MSHANTPIAFIKTILRAYQQEGISPHTALLNAKIGQTQLNQADGRISAAQMEIFCTQAMQDLDDEALGWYSHKLRWGSYGLLCRASLTAPNLGVAMRRWCRHHRLLTDDIVLDLQVRQNIATLSLEEMINLGHSRELCLLTTFRYFLGYASWLINSRITLAEVRFPFRKPVHGAFYPMLFNCPVVFVRAKAPVAHAQLIFSADYLSLAHYRHEEDLQKMLKHALYLTVHNYQKDKLLADRVREFMQAQRQQNPPFPPSKGRMAWTSMSMVQVAKKFNLSPRTLHRHLHEEGESWQKIKTAVRMQFAQQQLQHTTSSVKHIAFASGWKNEKSFSRAFHQWCGVSPQAFREHGH